MSTHKTLGAEAFGKKAPSPFDDPHADIIICSRDGTLFHMPKLILAQASVHFANMFTLPTTSPTTVTHISDAIDGIPVVNVTENTASLLLFLSFCHPAAEKPYPKTVYDILELYTLGDKYIVDSLKSYARRELSTFIKDQPVSVFVVATHLGWKEEAQAAARESVKLSLPDILSAGGKELDYVPAGILKMFGDYYRKYQAEALMATSPTFWYCEDTIEYSMDGIDEEDWPLMPAMSEERKIRNTRCRCDVRQQTDQGIALGECAWSSIEKHIIVLRWFDIYLQDIRAALQERPGLTDVVESAALMEGAMQEAVKCPVCCTIAFTTLRSYSSKIKSAADRLVLKVKLPQ